jgi:hypothetical protein
VFDFDKLGSEKTYRIRFFQEGSEQQRIFGTRKDIVDGIFKHLQVVVGVHIWKLWTTFLNNHVSIWNFDPSLPRI